ncbi:putative DNA binding protein [Hibiscus syriacus]|uniref:DNA binding protein n=1 Tax=Hibiscus syriacus TaxID=106335 RepID=A0A6A2X3Z8_HIBSY|nr:putative DNA binding protein [Hibiscus syriacus]
MSTSSSCSNWLLSYRKLKFFIKIRRYLQSKAATKRSRSSSSSSSENSNKLRTKNNKDEAEDRQLVKEKEAELDGSAVLQKSVKRLHFGSWEEKEMAVIVIEKLAREDDKARKLMVELGVIDMLVSMVATEVVSRHRAAIKALIELANGTFTHDFAEFLSSLSTLSNTHDSLTKPEILQFLIAILESPSSFETMELCLGVIHNLSAVLQNAGVLVSNGVVNTLLKLSSFKDLSEKALAALGHLVVTLVGKKAMEDSSMVPENLIEILTWEDKPKCQESSAYILMILAHQSSTQRDKMWNAGIVPVLIEVCLVGSVLAQKRAMKLLQWFKDERQAKMGPHSGPQTGRVAMGSPLHPEEAYEGKKMMKSLVKQSLYKNMEIITRRADGGGGVDSSILKSLVLTTSSKSFTF